MATARFLALPGFRLFFRGLRFCGPLLISAAAFGAVYDIGPGQAYTTIGAFNWSALQPGDTVRIHYATYHEFIGVTGQGTATQPIRVVGVPDSATGKLPIIDGSNATVGAHLNLQYSGGTPERGLVDITPYLNAPAGYKPAYIEIANLQIQNAYYNGTFKYANGTTGTYLEDSAGIYIVTGENIVVTNCIINGNSNGFFVASGDDNGGVEGDESRNITLQYSKVYGNGIPGQEEEHNIYTEGSEMTFQYNYLGSPVAGSGGNNLKDRSAGTVIRYNWIESGGHMLDLVDPEGSANITVQEPSFSYTYVYGNVLHNTSTVNMVHYGGDQGVPANDRNGTIYFYNNTVVVEADQSATYQTVLLQLDDSGLSTQTGAQHGDVRNNIFYVEPATAGAATPGFDFGCEGPEAIYANWIQTGWEDGYNYPFDPCGYMPVFSSQYPLFVDKTGNPGFTNASGGDYTLKAGSDAIDKSGPQAPAVTTNPMGQGYSVTRQYVVSQSEKARQVNGKALDFGAFEAGPAGACSYALYPVSAVAPAAAGDATVEILADAGCTWTSAPNDAWLGIVGGGSGSGTGNGTSPGELEYSFASNPGSAREGSITIAGQAFDISQAAVAAAKPTFTPPPGPYTSVETVTIGSTTPSATIYYTTDKTTPTTNSTKYSAAIRVSATETIEAIAAAANHSNSAVASATYTITLPAAATPKFSVNTGTYTSVQSVALTDATAGATIYYTTNNAAPTASSTRYTGAIAVPVSENIKAIAVAPDYSDSAVASASYTLVGSPTALASPASSVSATGATLNAIVSTFGLSGSYVFQYGASSTALTISTGSKSLPAATSSAAVSATVTGFKANTTYYFRIVVTTAGGTSTGDVLSFTTG